ncbi:MAG: extracellular solute-binding protein [Phycisphaeraceae bacterium]|nr:extracellular solute-binding protein [Phycisphaeraceae bacterium]
MNWEVTMRSLWLGIIVAHLLPAGIAPAQAEKPQAIITLRAWGVPDGFGVGPVQEAERQIMDEFRKRHPDINPVSPTGLKLPGEQTMDMVPMMQIAGDIAPDVLYVNFRASQTYIDMRLLYPLDAYVENVAGVHIENGYLLSTPEYLRRLKQGPGWPLIESRVLPQCWEVMRRQRPDGEGQHIYAYPVGPVVTGLMCERLQFAEHADEGVQMSGPKDWDQMLEWAKLMTDPANKDYGFGVNLSEPASTFANFLYAAGGQYVDQDEQGNWYCTIDSEAAVEAGYFWARLKYEKVIRDGKLVARGVVHDISGTGVRCAMQFTYLDDRFLQAATDQTKGFVPVPTGPTGLQRGEFNTLMVGIFSGLASNKLKRDAAWDYIQFFDGVEARRIRVEKLVEAGLGRFVRRKLLEQFNDNGRYDSVIRRIDPELERTYEIAFAGGVPEPYGKNCQAIYTELKGPVLAIWNNDDIRAAVDAGDKQAGKAIIRGIFRRAAERVNEKMLGNFTPQETRMRNVVSWSVIVVTLGSFAVLLVLVMKAFTPEHQRNLGGWQFSKYWKAYIIAAPALLLIAIWMYWPMVNGTAIAFQNYNVLGDSEWVGASNFSAVLYDSAFWYSLWVSIKYTILFMLFGFCAPILLAFLLSEVPRGKFLFRTIYYLPAVLTGVVVLFLWKSFYAPDGMINQVLNALVRLINYLPGVEMGYFNEDWLQNPTWALFFCLLPSIWAGMGPGCLIYLAALKTIPDELYEAADIDGATIRHKVFHVAVPTIKILVMINFIGAMIGAIRGSGGFVLAMTGGGPVTEAGGATEVVGLKLFYTTFGHLRFGVGAAMAWVIGAMLIGFTVFQLKRLSNVEFRTAGTN